MNQLNIQQLANNEAVSISKNSISGIEFERSVHYLLENHGGKCISADRNPVLVTPFESFNYCQFEFRKQPPYHLVNTKENKRTDISFIKYCIDPKISDEQYGMFNLLEENGISYVDCLIECKYQFVLGTAYEKVPFAMMSLSTALSDIPQDKTIVMLFDGPEMIGRMKLFEAVANQMKITRNLVLATVDQFSDWLNRNNNFLYFDKIAA